MKVLNVLFSIVLLCFISVCEAKSKKEYFVSSPNQPWLTNPAYLSDADTLAYVKENEKLSKQVENLEAYKKCKKMNFNCRTEVKSKYLKDNQKLFKRGTLSYVKDKYFYLKKFKRKGRKLKRLLTSLQELSKKTRKLGHLDKREKGELTYQDISAEICLIESNIGFLPSKRFCRDSIY